MKNHEFNSWCATAEIVSKFQKFWLECFVFHDFCGMPLQNWPRLNFENSQFWSCNWKCLDFHWILFLYEACIYNLIIFDNTNTPLDMSLPQIAISNITTNWYAQNNCFHLFTIASATNWEDGQRMLTLMIRSVMKVQHQMLHYHILADTVDPESTGRLSLYWNLMLLEKNCIVLSFGTRSVKILFNAFNSCFLLFSD